MKSAVLYTKYQLFIKKLFLTIAKRIHWYPSFEEFHRKVVTLDSFLLSGRIWYITGRLSTGMFMLLTRVRKGGTWQLLSWNIVMVGSYKNFSTLKMLSFWFRRLKWENHSNFLVSWYSCWLLTREASLDTVCISLYEPQTLIFCGVLGLSIPSLALWRLCWWCGHRDPLGCKYLAILLPSLSLGLALSTFYQCIFKPCKVWLQWEKKLEVGKGEKRDLVAAWSKKRLVKEDQREAWKLCWM